MQNKNLMTTTEKAKRFNLYLAKFPKSNKKRADLFYRHYLEKSKSKDVIKEWRQLGMGDQVEAHIAKLYSQFKKRMRIIDKDVDRGLYISTSALILRIIDDFKLLRDRFLNLEKRL